MNPSGLFSFLLPEQASSISPSVDYLIAFIFLVSIFSFVLVVSLGTYFVFRFRRKESDTRTQVVEENKKLEQLWTVVPSIILLVIFAWGFKVFMEMSVVPPRAMEVRATGQKWFWTFGYENGVVSTGELVVPLNQPVKILLSSTDVLHSFFVPAFRVKQDALPNRYTRLWFEPTKVGEFPLYCTEYCGTNHSLMTAMVRVLPQPEYDRWLEDKASESVGLDPVDMGKKVYKQNACFTCHSVDGSPLIGPSWKGAFGSMRDLADGTKVKVDENYIRESILNPMAKIAAGYEPSMPTYQGILKEKQIEGVIAYMKELGSE